MDKLAYDESCKLLLKYGFGELALNKVWTKIYSFDKKKKNLYNKLGFHHDGLLRQNRYRIILMDSDSL